MPTRRTSHRQCLPASCSPLLVGSPRPAPRQAGRQPGSWDSVILYKDSSAPACRIHDRSGPVRPWRQSGPLLRQHGRARPVASPRVPREPARIVPTPDDGLARTIPGIGEPRLHATHTSACSPSLCGISATREHALAITANRRDAAPLRWRKQVGCGAAERRASWPVRQTTWFNGNFGQK